MKLKLKLQFALWIVLIPMVALAAWQQQSSLHGRTTAPQTSWVELNGSMEKMHTAMGSVAPSGDSDIDFVKMMLPHHQAAIDMAKTQLVYGKDPQMRRLAQQIITDQQSEIELMQLWLKQRQSLSPKAN